MERRKRNLDGVRTGRARVPGAYEGRGCRQLIAAALTAFVIILVCGARSAASVRRCILVLPFLPEQGSQAPSWIGHAVTNSIRWKVGRTGGADWPSWASCRAFYEDEGRRWPTKALSDAELRSVARYCGMTAVVAGRYALEGRDLRIRCRVWNESKVVETSARFSLSDAYKSLGALAGGIARSCGLAVGADEQARIAAPDLNGSRSFEMLGRVSEVRDFERRREALKLADEWAKVDSESPLACYQQAVLRWQEDKNAGQWLERVLKKEPGNVWALRLLGDSFAAFDELEKARETYQKAVRLDPTDAQPLAALVVVELRLKKPRRAAALRQQAERLVEGEGWLAHLWLARELMEDRKVEVPVRHLMLALKLGAPRAHVHRYLGQTYYRHGRWPNAADAWKEALKATPRDMALLTSLGLTCARLRDFDEAERYMRQALELAPKDFRIRTNLASILRRQGKYIEAEAQCRAALAVAPDDQHAHAILARIYWQQDKYLQSLREATLASPRARRTAICTVLVLTGMFLAAVVLVTIIVRRALAPDGPRRRDWRRLEATQGLNGHIDNQ